MRAELYRRYTADDFCFLKDSEEVLPPTAYFDVHHGGRRALRLGGLKYRARGARPETWYEVELAHWAGNDFCIWLIVHQGLSVFTRWALTKPFDQIDVCIHSCVHQLRKEELPINTPLVENGERPI